MYLAHGKLIWGKWVKYKTLHNYRFRQFHRTSTIDNLFTGLRDMHSDPWASPYGSNGQMVVTRHKYRSRQFHTDRAWGGENTSSAFKDVHSVKSGLTGARFDRQVFDLDIPITTNGKKSFQLFHINSGPWANPYESNGQPWVNPYWLDEQMILILHNYRLIQFHRTSNGENLPSGFRDIYILQSLDPTGTRFDTFFTHGQLHNGANRQMNITWHNYRSRQVHRTSNGDNLSSVFRNSTICSV